MIFVNTVVQQEHSEIYGVHHSRCMETGMGCIPGTSLTGGVGAGNRCQPMVNIFGGREWQERASEILIFVVVFRHNADE